MSHLLRSIDRTCDDGPTRRSTTAAQIRSSSAQRGQAEAALEGARRDVHVDVKRADRGVAVATTSSEIAQRSRDSVSEEDRLTRIAFQGAALRASSS